MSVGLWSKKNLVAFAFGVLGVVPAAEACDLCSIYAAQDIRDSKPGRFSAGIFEQFTNFHTVQEDGKQTPNDGHQSLSSSITQIWGRYDFNQSIGSQMTIPLINRQYKRIEAGELEQGHETGLGDISLLGLYSPLKYNDEDFFARITLRAGVKLPTGDASRVKEETEEHDGAPAEDAATVIDEHFNHELRSFLVAHTGHSDSEATNAEIESGIHGHDLALGSGSVDTILGAALLVEKDRFFTTLDIQYTLRSEGDYHYRFQNDFVWSSSLGAYIMTNHDSTLSVRANLSGEYKGYDIFAGNKAIDTGINSLFLGPEVDATFQHRLIVLLGVDLPIVEDNTAFQAVPDYRIRLGLSYRF